MKLNELLELRKKINKNTEYLNECVNGLSEQILEARTEDNPPALMSALRIHYQAIQINNDIQKQIDIIRANHLNFPDRDFNICFS